MQTGAGQPAASLADNGLQYYCPELQLCRGT